MTNASAPDDEEHLPLNGRVVIQGLVFTWACASEAMLKVEHPQYGMRVVSLGRHYEPATLAKLTALGMLATRTNVDLTRPAVAGAYSAAQLARE